MSGVPSNIKIDPIIKYYIEGYPQLTKSTILKPKNPHIDTIYKKFVGDRKEDTEKTTIKASPIKIPKIKDLEASELLELEKLLTIDGDSKDPAFVEGELSKALGLCKNTMLRSSCQKKQDIKLSDGQIMTRMEQIVINLFTENAYLLLNGTLDKDETSLKMFIEKRFMFDRKNKPKGEPAEKKILEEAQKYVPILAKTLASAISKVKSIDESLYRGDSMKVEDLKEWRKGKHMITSKFFCCSTNIEVSERFAKSSSLDYMKRTNEAYKPVLYVFQSTTSKNISAYAYNKEEEERLYPPGQLFHSIEVDEETVPGLAIIYLEET